MVPTKMKVLVTLALLVSVSFCAQVYPGTPTRPILSDEEAASFTKAEYLRGWKPPSFPTDASFETSYTVGGSGCNYITIQSAVNAAIAGAPNSNKRQYIKINKGIYNEVVYIPPTNVSITLYGAEAPSTEINFALSSSTTGSAYKKLIGKRTFDSEDPGYQMYLSCASRAVIGANCSSVVWSKAKNVQIINLTIRNLAKPTGSHRAVALYTEGDQVQVANSGLLSYQRTFWSGATGNAVTRGHVTNTYIEGDVDYVFGGGSTVFERCAFYTKSNADDFAVIFAPVTDDANKYGFLVSSGTITGDKGWFNSKNVNLARAEGPSRSGQLVVRESTIDAIIHVEAPYATAISGEPRTGNANKDRDLNDLHFNRFWEHRNTGGGA